MAANDNTSVVVVACSGIGASANDHLAFGRNELAGVHQNVYSLRDHFEQLNH